MEEYKLTYYFIYSIVAFFAILYASSIDFKKENYAKISQFALFSLALVFMFLFGLRGVDVGTDTSTYLYLFKDYKSIEFGTDLIMYYIYKVFDIFDYYFQYFLLLMSSLFVGFLGVSIHKNSKEFSTDPFLIFFSFISLFYFQSVGINVIRQGVSLSFLLLAIINHQSQNKIKISWIIPSVLAVLFHFTSIVPILIYMLIVYFKNIKIHFFYIFYTICFITASFGLSILSFQDYLKFLSVDDRRSNYLMNLDESYSIGFKPQFVAFNTLFLIYFTYIAKQMNNNSYYDRMLKYYLTMSGIFFLTFQIQYSDRWGLVSWIVIPLLIAPVFSLTFPKRVALFSVCTLIFVFIFFENYK